MGPDVLVTNLWEIRDFWQWLFPGRGQSERDAQQRGAIIYYERIQHYRDFEFRREDPEPGNIKVGMWAKAYMSDPTLDYVGTITTWRLYKDIVKSRRPEKASPTTKEDRVAHANQVLRDLLKAKEGKFKDQFSPARLADAIAVCQGNWSHFHESAGALPAQRQLIPPELALNMQRRGLRNISGSVARRGPEPAVGQGWAESNLSARPPPMRQRLHTLAAVNGISHAPNVTVAPPFGGSQPKTLEEFRQRPIAAGMYVLTHAAPSSRAGRASAKLRELTFWVWKVLWVYDPGAMLPPNSLHLAQGAFTCYEAHLHVPAHGTSWSKAVRPIWDVQSEAQFLYTREEKAARRAGTQSSRRTLGQAETKRIHVPLVAMLRRDNILGGGFLLTSAGRVPAIVMQFMAQRPD